MSAPADRPLRSQPINQLSVYSCSGRKAGRARKNRDEAFYQSEVLWFRKALSIEGAEFKEAARLAWNKAYSDEATPSTLSLP